MTGALLVAVAGILAGPIADPPAPHDLERDIALLDRAARARVSLSLRVTTLGETIAAIGKDAGIETRGDWAMLGLIGADPREAFDLEVTDGSPLAALEALAIRISRDQDRPIVEAHAGQLLLTLPLALPKLVGTATYAVDDLVAPAHAGVVGGEDPDASRDERMRDLMDLLQNHVMPDAWLDFGGDLGRMSAAEGRLVVTATPSMHRAIRTLLEGLREALPGTARVDLRVYRIPPASIADIRAAREDPRDLAAEIAARFPDALVSAPGIVARVGERASLLVGSGGGATSFEIHARRNDERGVTVIDLAYAETEGDTPACRAEATLLVAGRRATETIVLPARKPGAPATVLVIDARLRGLERGPSEETDG